MPIKKKQMRNIIIGAVVLAVLLAGYFIALKWEPTKEEPVSYQPKGIELLNPKLDDVEFIKVKNPDREYTLLRDNDGNILVPEYKEIEFSQTKIGGAFFGLMNVTAEEEITRDVSRLDDFGLIKSQAELTIGFKDKTEKKFLIGDSLPGEESYYFMEYGGDVIYSLSPDEAKAIFADINNYRERFLFSVDKNSLKGMTVKKDGKTLMQMRSAKDGEVTFNTLESVWVMEYPYMNEGIAEDRMGTFADIFADVQILEFIDDNPSDLNKYGLGKTRYEIEFKTSGSSYLLYIGDAAENGVYIQYGGEKNVYLSDIAYFDAVKNFDAAYYVTKFVHLARIEDISSALIEKDGKVYSMEVSDKEYRINGRKVEESDFKSAYQTVIGVLYIEMGDFNISGNPFMSITYKFKNGDKDVTKYYDFDERYYVAERSNGKRLTVLKSTLGELFDQIGD